MMYTVIDKQHTIMVDHVNNFFYVTDMATGTSEVVSDSKLHGTSFKYPSDFISKFLERFSDKFSVIFTLNAESAYMRLMNANREGIFDD